ncbi:MAG: hypothetical protein IKN73_02350 [Alphaproteobacteria bacterium]|nr:hypothetical protein [Alphaproteobacteria bacterium]
MFNGIKIYTEDTYWNHILNDLGADIVNSPNIADVIFDEIDIDAPVYIYDLQNIILKAVDNHEIVHKIFGDDVNLSQLQRKIIVMLYKNPDVNINELKSLLGLAPDISSHAVETAVYQLRKKYGHDVIINTNGKYKIGKI